MTPTILGNDPIFVRVMETGTKSSDLLLRETEQPASETLLAHCFPEGKEDWRYPQLAAGQHSARDVSRQEGEDGVSRAPAERLDGDCGESTWLKGAQRRGGAS